MISSVRFRVTLFNLVLTGAVLTFYSSAPAFGFPAEWGESLSIAQMITPVFIGNLGFAAAFAAGDQPQSTIQAEVDHDKVKLMALLVYGSIVVFCVVTVVASAVFWITNRRAPETSGHGMSLPILQTIIAGSLSLNTATSNHLMARLFPHRPTRSRT